MTYIIYTLSLPTVNPLRHHTLLTGKYSKADIESDKIIKSDLSIGGVSGGDCPDSLRAETVAKASETLLELSPVYGS